MVESTCSDEAWMDEAIKVAKLGLASGEVPVGCVFVKDGAVIAKAHNLTVVTRNATTHCEINCIRELTASLGKEACAQAMKQATLYVTVEPCIMCAYALNIMGVPRVVFGCDNDKFGGNGSILSLHQFKAGYEVVRGVRRDQAVSLLQQFYEHGNLKVPEAKRQRKT